MCLKAKLHQEHIFLKTHYRAYLFERLWLLTCLQENQASVVAAAAHAQSGVKPFQVNMSQRYTASALVMQPQLRLRPEATLGIEGEECEARSETKRHFRKGRWSFRRWAEQLLHAHFSPCVLKCDLKFLPPVTVCIWWMVFEVTALAQTLYSLFRLDDIF